MLRIALVTEELGWHSAELINAFHNHQCQVTDIALTECSFNTSSEKGLCLPQFNNQLPDGVFVRGVPAGSLETVTFYLFILHSLQQLGVFVYNSASMIERTVDKVMTSFLLHQANIQTPLTWSFANWDDANDLVKRQLLEQHQKLVIKPIFGSQGKDLRLINHQDDWQIIYQMQRDENIVCYLQSFIESEDDSDIRVFVVGGKAVVGMKRKSSSWVNNVACGAQCFPLILEKDMIDISEKAVAQLKLFYGGVDLIRDKEGKLWVIEVNSIPAWKGLQSVTSIDIADSLVEDFTQSLRNDG